MINPGWIPMVFLILGFGLFMDVGTTSAINDQREMATESALHAYIPVAVSGWETAIAAQVKASGVDAQFTAPASLAKTSLCPSAQGSSCAIYGSASYAVTDASGGNYESKYYTQRATGNLCTVAATGYTSGTITVTITNGDGDTIGTDTLTTSDTTLCGYPYVQRTGLSDDQGSVTLDASGAYRTAGTSVGCWGSDPVGCDTLQAANGSSSASDMKVHAILECTGKYCSSGESKNVDNFQTLTTQNGGASGAGLTP